MTLSYIVTLTLDVDLVSLWGDRRPELSAPAQTPTAVHAKETDIVELGLALHAAGIFPGLTQEAIMDRMRQLSGFPLQNWEQLGANIRRRDSLKFLDRLRKCLWEHNEEIKENGHANRRPKFP